jgi:hypothetical protein
MWKVEQQTERCARPAVQTEGDNGIRRQPFLVPGGMDGVRRDMEPPLGCAPAEYYLAPKDVSSTPVHPLPRDRDTQRGRGRPNK